MSPTPPSPLNLSHAAERIREIIVGRHLEKLEERVARLASAGSTDLIPSQSEDQPGTYEARLESLQHSIQRLTESSREKSELRSAQQREEIQRLAAEIQQVAALKSAENAQPAIAQIERKISTWLTNWQDALQTHLDARESRLARQLFDETAALWENTESQIPRMQCPVIDHDAIEERFSRIAAARSLADCATPITSGTEDATR